MAIRTPDQRLRVFVSSTLQELADERRAVREAVEALHLTPVMFELGARPHPPRALYRAYLDQSDVFIGLYWQRHGWVEPGEQLSGLEDEYRSAGDRPKLIYLKEPAPDREPRLARLLAEIQADDRVSYRRFSDVGELRSLVADDLAVLLSERFSDTATRRTGGPLRPPRESSLPRPLTRLIGRDADVEHLATILGDPARRLVTVVGPGGVGKTRVALAVAERLRDAYADGVFFVALAGLAEPQLVIPTIARALGVPEDGGLDLVLRRVLASAQCLVILDSFEQLADAAPELVDVLASTLNVQMLVTSRRVLNVNGEHVFEVGPLEIPTGGIGQGPAVELFLDRVVADRPGFVPDEDDRAAIRELTRRLDGLPLAIELAAAQMRVLTARGLLERMGERPLDVLRGGPRDLPARHRTLREAIAWSYDLLDPAERALFERSAVIAGSATLTSIEVIADAEGAFDIVGVLGSLVEASLMRATGEGGEPRFGMLETVREFASERLEASGQAERYRERHAEHYLALGTQGSLGLRGPEQLKWLDRFDREHENLRAVLRRAIRQGDAGRAVRLGSLLSWFWQMRSLYTEGRAWMQAAREIPDATPHDRAVAWTVGAMLAFWQREFDVLEAGADEAIESLRAQRDAPMLGLALLLRAVVGGAGPGHPVAQDAAAEASALLDIQADPFLQALPLLLRSDVARRAGRSEEAAALAEQGLHLSTLVGDSYIRGIALHMTAAAALARGVPAEAGAHAREALITARDLRNPLNAALALELWAAAELQGHRAYRAGRLYALAERAYELANAQAWRADMELHASLEEGLRQALGPRLDGLLVDARARDLDASIAELTPPAVRTGSSVQGNAEGDGAC